jgi:hypothetical protein
MLNNQIQQSTDNRPSHQLKVATFNSIVPFAASALSGFIVCFAITVVTGTKEAWDNEAYFSIGIPVMCLLIFAISYKFPLNVWRWAVAMAVGQSIAILLAGNSLNLWPLSIIAMSILSIPQLAAAFIGAKFAPKGNAR